MLNPQKRYVDDGPHRDAEFFGRPAILRSQRSQAWAGTSRDDLSDASKVRPPQLL